MNKYLNNPFTAGGNVYAKKYGAPNSYCTQFCHFCSARVFIRCHSQECLDIKDNYDIQREVRNMFMRTNLLLRRFSKCSYAVKLVLFRAYCICLYDACLWSNYNTGCLTKLKLCYHTCIKMFFGFKRCYSVTQILFNLSLPSFDTLLHNSRVLFFHAWCKCPNMLVSHMQLILPCKCF